MVVRAVRFDEINSSEFVFDVGFDIADFEVEPLGVGGRVLIILQDQVVGVRLLHLDHSSQIARLKA